MDNISLNEKDAAVPGFGDEIDSPKYRKRSDLIAHAIKKWVVDNGKSPGDKLPIEKELAELFKASKNVIREALKSLEVQGLIVITTGPNGGARIRDVPDDTAVGLLSNSFSSKIQRGRCYEMSRILEPAVSERVVGHLSEEQFEDLENIIKICKTPAAGPEDIPNQLMAEVRFHEILAEACPNAFLSFFCRFMKK